MKPSFFKKKGLIQEQKAKLNSFQSKSNFLENQIKNGKKSIENSNSLLKNKSTNDNTYITTLKQSIKKISEDLQFENNQIETVQNKITDSNQLLFSQKRDQVR